MGSTAAAASGDLEYLRDKLRKATRHLVWLASTVARLPNLHPDQPLGEFARELNTALAAPPTEPDINFRRELETDFRSPWTAPVLCRSLRLQDHFCRCTSPGTQKLNSNSALFL